MNRLAIPPTPVPAPLAGLFGTVSGTIGSFDDVTQVVTAGGRVVAIPAVARHPFSRSRTEICGKPTVAFPPAAVAGRRIQAGLGGGSAAGFRLYLDGLLIRPPAMGGAVMPGEPATTGVSASQESIQQRS